MSRYRKPVQPDPVLLAQVSDDVEVDLGTYPEAAVAVVGAYPRTGSLDQSPDEVASPFRRLDSQARAAAMQSALDMLIADGTLNLSAGAGLESVVADGLHGRLAVSGPMARLYDLSCWLRLRVRAEVIVTMQTTGGLQGVQMPDGICDPGSESCFALKPPRDQRRDRHVFLVERRDRQAGLLSYTLRTVRREFTRMAGFLFADVTTPGQALVAGAHMKFQIGPTTVYLTCKLVRKHGEDTAAVQVTAASQGAFSRPGSSGSGRLTYDQAADGLTAQFTHAWAACR